MPLHGSLCRRTLVLAAVLAVLALLCASPAEAQRATRRAAFIDGPPFDLDKLITLATAKGAGGRPLVPAETVIEAVRNRKVAFPTSDENLAKLRGAGVAEEVIDVVREVNPPPAPVEPPPPATGMFSLSCAPRECTVQIDGGLLDQTKAGMLRRELEAGSHVVELSAAGYSNQRHTIEVTPEGARLNAALEPDAATQRTLGYALIEKMLTALGDENATVNARGSWTVQKTGLPAEQSFAAQLSGNQVVMTVLTPAGVYEMTCQGETCLTRKPTLLRGKELKGADAQRIDSELKVFRRFNVTRLASEIRARRANTLQATAPSDLPGADGNYHLRLEGSGEIYDLTLNQRWLPSMVAYTSKLGTGPPLRVNYADYADLGKVQYPKHTQISVPDPAVGLIQIRFDAFPPSLR